MRYDTLACSLRTCRLPLAANPVTPRQLQEHLVNRRVGALWERLDRLAAQGGRGGAERGEDVVAPLIESGGLRLDTGGQWTAAPSAAEVGRPRRARGKRCGWRCSRGAVRRGGAVGAVTVIGATVMVPGGMAGAAGFVWSAGCGDVSFSLAAGACSLPGAPVAGAMVCGDCSCWFCGCETATPAQQVSQRSDELLRSSKRLLQLDILSPCSFSSENDPPRLAGLCDSAPHCADRQKVRRAEARGR